MTQGRLQQIISQYRKQLKAHEATAEASLEAAYGGVLQIIGGQLDILYQAMTIKLKAGETIPLEWLYENRRLQTISQFIEGQINHFGALTQMQVGQLQHQAVQMGQQAAQLLLQSTVPAGVSWSFGIPSPKAIADLVGATQAGSPLADLFNGFGAEAAKGASDALVTGVSLGYNPHDIAPMVQQALDVPRWRALTINRTEMLRSYRGANLETFRANDDVVGGWIWQAALDRTTCFPAGTVVETESGAKIIEDIRPGEKVLTHTGKYQRVIATSVAPRTFYTTTIRTKEGGAVSATLDHPFLIERQGQLNWVEASDLRLGDHVFRKIKGHSEVGYHGFGYRTVKWSIRQTYNPISSRLKPQGFTSITFSDISPVMPIQAVNLETGIQPGQIEINRITPPGESIFLPVLNPQSLEAKSSNSLGFSFANISPVAAYRAEKPITPLRWPNTKLFRAIQATVNDSRATALLRAMFHAGASRGKYLAASFARYMYNISELAGIRAKSILPGLAWHNSKILATSRASFSDVRMLFPAFETTKVSRFIMLSPKSLATVDAGMLSRWYSGLASSSMWVHSLIKRITGSRAATPSTFPNPSIGNCKRFITLDTNLFHINIISDIDTHIHPVVPVYNLEVEEDHSYVANGFVVHNCAACIAMNGSEHSLDESLDSHPNCRCVAVPRTKGWDDILGPLGIDMSDIPETSVEIESGSDWFDRQSEATQRAILGDSKYAAWSNGDFSLSDIVGTNNDPDWGSSIYERSLKDLLKAGKS